MFYCVLLKILLCGNCKRVAYCSVACQKQHWKSGHKQECQTFVDVNSKDNSAEIDEMVNVMDGMPPKSR